ncbi:MAG: DUF6364 family protein [Bacteroidota bacterium]|nr:DUF6364 family protein [Bacteroidota bacterium]
MDNKITLSFDANIISKAKEYAESNNISVSRLVEFLLQKVTTSGYHSLEDYPISQWVSQVAEGEASYQTKKRSNKSLKDEYFASKR